MDYGKTKWFRIFKSNLKKTNSNKISSCDIFKLFNRKLKCVDEQYPLKNTIEMTFFKKER